MGLKNMYLIHKAPWKLREKFLMILVQQKKK